MEKSNLDLLVYLSSKLKEGTKFDFELKKDFEEYDCNSIEGYMENTSLHTQNQLIQIGLEEMQELYG